MQVRVKPTNVQSFFGYYGLKRRYPGDVFELVAKKDKKGKVYRSAEDQFSANWMEKVNKPGRKPKEKIDESYSSTSEEGGLQPLFIMSLDTFDNLKIEIIDWSHRGGLDGKIDSFISLAETEMYSNPTKVLKVRSGETLATGTASTSSRFLALPTGFIDMRRVRINTTTGFFRLSYRTPEQLVSTDGPGRPRFFTVTDQIEFDTVPDEAYTLEFQYMAEFTALSTSNQTNPILTNEPNIYLFGALKQAFVYATDEQEAMKYHVMFIDAIKGANKKYNAGKYGQSPVMKVV